MSSVCMCSQCCCAQMHETKLVYFQNLVNCPCQNSSGTPFFNIQCSAGAGYKSSLIWLMEKKSCFFFNSVTVVCDHQIVLRLTGETEGKDFVWPFKLMSKRQNQMSLPVLCISPALHSEQVVHEGHDQCVCVCVCVCVCIGGGLQKHTEKLLIQAECGAEELGVKRTNKLATHHCSYNKNRYTLKRKRPGEFPLLYSKC